MKSDIAVKYTTIKLKIESQYWDWWALAAPYFNDFVVQRQPEFFFQQTFYSFGSF
jgi:hypothetical protein